MRIFDCKLTDLEVKDAEGGSVGLFTGYGSVFGVKDLQGDIVERGAFAKTIADRGGQIPLLWMHDARQPIGKGVVSEDERGLKLEGQLNLEKQVGREAYSDLKAGIVSGLSIGYYTVKDSVDKDGTRHLKELKLREVSLVTFPANEAAQVTGVKGDAIAELLAELKEGRVFSRANQDRLTRALAELQSALASAATEDTTAVADPPTDPKSAGHLSLEPELLHSLRALNTELKKVA
jgi:HK97 family phage prohead protease